MRILLVEDDDLLGDALTRGLSQAGFEVDAVADGVAALDALAAECHAAVVLDLGLPKLDGLAVLRRLRARGLKLPVLILTARDALDDRVRGLDGGADDYVVKPVDLPELAARLRALIRRSRGEAAPTLVVGAIELDPAARRVRFRDRTVDLHAREFALLQELMLNAGRVLTREQLEDRLYRWGEEVESNAVEVHVHRLRRKLDPGVIRTIRGVGYLVPRPGRTP
ncbi:MAG: response regulator transcription factor [Burkholderiales bacterium]|nr:response regulator transcription factor [Burkholderiales bacterium]GIK86062.1 MAG: DNA-binding response regulator [Betaproteobacteria bacterium]